MKFDLFTFVHNLSAVHRSHETFELMPDFDFFNGIYKFQRYFKVQKCYVYYRDKYGIFWVVIFDHVLGFNNAGNILHSWWIIFLRTIERSPYWSSLEKAHGMNKICLVTGKTNINNRFEKMRQDKKQSAIYIQRCLLPVINSFRQSHQITFLNMNSDPFIF